MALIGSVAINCQARTAELAKGFGKASAMTKSWSASASKDFSAGYQSIAKGFSQVGDAASSIGHLVRDSLKAFNPFVNLGKAWASYLIPELTGPIRESFAFVLGGVGSYVAKATGPARSAFANFANATGKALQETYGKIGGKVGAGLKSWFGQSNLGPIAVQFARLGSGLGSIARGLGSFAAGLGKIAWGAASSGASALTSALTSASRSILSVGTGLAKIAAIGGVVGTILGVKAAGAAAHLTETFNKTNQVFGKDGAGVVATAEKMNAAFGVSRKEFLDGASAIGGMLQGMGYAQKDAAGLSSSLARLAADAAAFRDVPLDVALQKIRSGLSGEAEPLKEWGVLIDEASVKNEALRMGIIKQGQDLSQAGKVQARLSLITKGLGKDSGALTRESTGTAAQMAEVWGRLQTLWEQIGASIAPALGVALQGVNQAIVAAGLAWEDGKAAVLGWFGVTNESLGQANGGVGILQASIGWLADAWSVVKGATAGFFSYFESGISAISGWLSSIFGALEKIGAGDWATSARKALDDYSAAAKTVSDDLWKSSQEAFGSTGKGSAAVDDYFARAAQKIEAAKAELAKTNGVNAAVKPTAAAAEADDKKKKKGKGEQFAGAFSAGSKEAANVVLKSRYGSGGDDAAKAAKATAANTKAAADATIDLGRKFGDWLTKQATAAAAQLVSL